MTRKRAAVYTRMRDFTVLDREHADFQVKEIMLYADDNGYRVIRTYRDLPDIGLDFLSGLADLAADAKKGQFDVVLVYDRRQLYASWWKRWWYMLTLWLRTGVTVKRMDSHYGRRLARLASTTKPAVVHDRGSRDVPVHGVDREKQELHLPYTISEPNSLNNTQEDQD